MEGQEADQKIAIHQGSYSNTVCVERPLQQEVLRQPPGKVLGLCTFDIVVGDSENTRLFPKEI